MDRKIVIASHKYRKASIESPLSTHNCDVIQLGKLPKLPDIVAIKQNVMMSLYIYCVLQLVDRYLNVRAAAAYRRHVVPLYHLSGIKKHLRFLPQFVMGHGNVLSLAP